jgi:PucR family transcriptional regulator, purine catabolism regulatory protein
MQPTVATILALDAVQAGRPRVVAGAGRLDGRLDGPVRWVHAIEMADAARLLRGGELVLTTGIALPDDPPSLDAYVGGLAGVGVSAVAVEPCSPRNQPAPPPRPAEGPAAAAGPVTAASRPGWPLRCSSRSAPGCPG